MVPLRINALPIPAWLYISTNVWKTNKKQWVKWKNLHNTSFCDSGFYFFLVIEENNYRREFKFSQNIDISTLV